MDKRNGAILLLCAASVMLLVSLITKGWYRGEKHGIKSGINMWGMVENCPKGASKKHCLGSTLKLSDLRKGSEKAWLVFGKAGMIVGAISAILLLVLSGLLGGRNPATKPTAIAALIGVSLTTVCALLFLILKPDGVPGIGYSVYLFFPSAVAGIAASRMAIKALDYLAEPDHNPIA